jgi:UDP-N-acetylglucosamine pyrophosphorylase
MFVKREEEFAPIKNGWNSEVDSPRSARRLLAAHYRRRIERAGGKVMPDVADNPDELVEVSPLVSDHKLALLVKDNDVITGPAILQ